MRMILPVRHAILAVALAGCLVPAATRAGSQPSTQVSGTGRGGTAATIPTTAGGTELVPAASNGMRIYLEIKNQHTAAIACRFGAAPAVGGAGSYDIPAGWLKTWTGPYVPADQVKCISASGTANVTWTAY